MPAKFTVKVDQPAWLKLIRDKQRPVATAAVRALNEVATEAVMEGRSNIASSGGFTKRWVTGLQYQMHNPGTPGEPSMQAEAEIYHTIALTGVFESGITIAGRPLIWIPTKRELRNIPPRRARRYGVKLVSATIHGQPVLFDANDPDRHRKPLYIGVPSVRIPKKWRIIEIVKEHAKQIGLAFIKHFKDN